MEKQQVYRFTFFFFFLVDLDFLPFLKIDPKVSEEIWYVTLMFRLGIFSVETMKNILSSFLISRYSYFSTLYLSNIPQNRIPLQIPFFYSGFDWPVTRIEILSPATLLSNKPSQFVLHLKILKFTILYQWIFDYSTAAILQRNNV